MRGREGRREGGKEKREGERKGERGREGSSNHPYKLKLTFQPETLKLSMNILYAYNYTCTLYNARVLCTSDVQLAVAGKRSRRQGSRGTSSERRFGGRRGGRTRGMCRLGQLAPSHLATWV